MVEGDGEVRAVPELIRRIGYQLDPPVYPEVPEPVLVKRQQIVKQDYLERFMRLATLKLEDRPGGVLLLIDAETDCPAELGPRLLGWAQASHPQTAIGVVLAKRMYEAWFLAAAESLRGRRDLRDDLVAPDDPETTGGPKAWLREQMPPNRRYDEVRDMVALTAALDLELARTRSPSFDKCWRVIKALLTGD